jgi:ADP-ribose pyrophosphatase YjhB (NUDIX family)
MMLAHAGVARNIRSVVGSDVILQVGVKILPRNKEGQYLLLRRSLEKYPEAEGRWDIVGGRIEPGSALLENLQREVYEETGLEIISEPELIAAQDILKNGRHIVRLTYTGEVAGEIQLDELENDMYRWYTRDELMGLKDMDVYLREVLSKWKI